MAEFVGSIGALVLVLCINGMLMIGQVTMNAMAAEESIVYPGVVGGKYFANNGSVLCGVGDCDAAGNPLGVKQGQSSLLPSSQSGSYVSGGSTFTDLWNTVKGWVVGAGSFLFGMVAAPILFLNSVGMVGGALGTFAWIIGIIWSGFSLLVIINFVRGN